MRLFQAIIEANQQAAAPGAQAALSPDDYADALPLVVLTCIDPRLNRLVPAVLGVPEEKLIWLRNAGNMITGPLSSTMRSLALACAVKGGREIAVIGHSDCLVAKSGTLQLLENFARIGVERSKLPENLNEFFGMFASERQNVIKACEIIRSSPLIGIRVPVHGLLLDAASGRLEWLVNGYEAPGSTVASDFTASLNSAMDKSEAIFGDLEAFTLGEMKFPETRIGEVVGRAGEVAAKVGDFVAANPEAQTPLLLAAEAAKDFARHIVRDGAYKVIGEDKRQYGPISGEKLLQWIAEERVDGKTLVQPEGLNEWKPLERLGEWIRAIPRPPVSLPKSGIGIRRPGQR